MKSQLKNPKKIDVVVKYFYPVAAGIETNILEVYSILSKLGWDVTVHTSNYDYTTNKILAFEETIRGIKIKRQPMWKFYMWPDLNLKNTRVICLHNFNVIPHFNILFITLIRKLLNLKNYKLFIIPHGGFSPEWSLFGKGTRNFKSFYHNYIAVPFINSAVDGIRAVAKWEKEEMVNAGINSQKVKVISNGIENVAYSDIDKLTSPEIKKKVKSFGKYLIQIGRVYAIKNQEAAILALKDIDPSVKLVLVGPTQDKEYERRLLSLINKLKLTKRVIFLGVVRGADKYYLLKHARAVVHMALWEANCNVINEAWSQKTLCIVADALGLNEQVKDSVNGFLVPQNDIKYLSKVISNVIKNGNGQKIQKMKQRNLEYVKDNSWENVAERVENLYKS